MKKSFILIILISVMSCVSTNQPTPKLPKNEYASIIPTIDYSFSDKWFRTISSNTPMLQTTYEVVKGQRVFIEIIFFNYGLDINNNAEIVYDIEVLTPSGSTYFKQDKMLGINRKIEIPSIQRVESMLRLSFDPEDEFGIYKINVKIYDIIEKTNYTLTEKIELVQNKNKTIIETDDQFSEWMMNYYKTMTPQNAVDAYVYYINSELSRNENSFTPVFSFFCEIFKNNSYLVTPLINEYGNQELNVKYSIMYLLYYLTDNQESEIFLNSLIGKEGELYNNLKQQELLTIPEEATSPVHLDMLWGEFFAGGKYDSILKLVKVLKDYKYSGSIQRFKEDPSDENKISALKEATYKAAIWSLHSNSENHSLVRSYLEYIYRVENFDDNIKEQLRMILKYD